MGETQRLAHPQLGVHDLHERREVPSPAHGEHRRLGPADQVRAAQGQRNLRVSGMRSCFGEYFIVSQEQKNYI